MEIFIAVLSSTLITFIISYLCFKAKKSAMETEMQEKIAQLTLQLGIDVLTKTPNLRAFNSALKRFGSELPNSEGKLRHANRKSVALFALDIDFFKAVNDRYGHQTGDEVLIDFASVVKSVIRPNDMLCRTGGEEFMLLCQDVTGDEIRLIGEKICQVVAKHLFKGPKRITVSIGAVEAVFQSQVGPGLIKMADDALYKAKNNGRNQIVIHKHKSD